MISSANKLNVPQCILYSGTITNYINFPLFKNNMP